MPSIAVVNTLKSKRTITEIKTDCDIHLYWSTTNGIKLGRKEKIRDEAKGKAEQWVLLLKTKVAGNQFLMKLSSSFIQTTSAQKLP